MADRSALGDPVLELAGLTVAYRPSGSGGAPGRRRGEATPANVVDGIDLRVAAGEVYGLVGESGGGKTTTGRAITRSLPPSARVSGAIRVAGRDVLALGGDALRDLRSREVATVHQEPGSALNPTMRVGRQVAEVFENLGVPHRDAAAAAIDVLGRTALADPSAIARRYPHELSGGQQQRVVIAMAVAARPRLLILDEPTIGLDATTEAGVLELVAELRRDIGAAVLFISHDLALVRRVCDRVGVLYSGQIVEEGAAGDVIDRPQHPYSDGLRRCVPSVDVRRGTVALEPLPGTLPSPADRPAGCRFSDRCHAATADCRSTEPLLTADQVGRRVRCWHPGARPPGRPLAPAAVHPGTGRGSALVTIEGVTKRYGDVVACDDVHLTIGRGEVVGVVGESGSGKTTLARCVVGLTGYEGRIALDGLELVPIVERRRRDVRRQVQMVFQNPDVTLNPRHTVRQVLRRAIRRLGGTFSAEDLAALVRLDPSVLTMPTLLLSGGQKQRVAIARAFAGRPALVVCDEPVSALDVSVQAAILQLLTDLQRRAEVSYLFVSHDLGVVRHVADRIAVMYRGQIVEIGAGEDVFDGPRHPYTDALVTSAMAATAGAVPPAPADALRASASESGDGCRFHPRCPHSVPGLCHAVAPPWRTLGERHEIRCHLDRGAPAAPPNAPTERTDPGTIATAPSWRRATPG